jgi:hypothetical protein
MNAPEREHASSWIDTDIRISDTYRALNEAFAELWNDPAVTDYDRCEDLRNQDDAIRN